MYSLTLTADERRAFNWVGSRYNSGLSDTNELNGRTRGGL